MCVDWKGFSTPRYLYGHGIEKERQLCLNIAFVNVATERAEHRLFHIILDKFGIFTMTIRGFSFDKYYSLHDGKYWYV